MLSNQRIPLPSSTGTRSTPSPSSSPALRHCCEMSAPLIATIFSPAAALACATAASTPSVTNVNGVFPRGQSAGGWCVTTNTGTPSGWLPPHAPATAYCRLPQMWAPTLLSTSRSCRALSSAVRKVMSSRWVGTSTSPLPSQPNRCSTSSFGPATPSPRFLRRPQVAASPADRNLSRVIGRSLPTMPISPMPLVPIGLTYGSSSSTQSASIVPTSALVAMWYWAKSWLITCPNRGSTTLSSCSAIDRPHVMPPSSCERAVLGLTIRPTAKTPSRRGTRTSPVFSCTRTSANCAPKLCIANCWVYGLSGISALTSSPSAGTVGEDVSRSRRRRAASKIAEPQLVIPVEPPATDATGRAVSPMCRSTSLTATSKASAAIWVSAVQVPVPKSAAPISTWYRPSGPTRIVATDPGSRNTG